MIKYLYIIFVGIAIISCLNNKSYNQSSLKTEKPNYALVFPNDKVSRIDIKIEAQKWGEMRADLDSNIGDTSRRMLLPNKNVVDEKSNTKNISAKRKEERHVGRDLHREHNKNGDFVNTYLSKSDRRMEPPPGGRRGGVEFKPVWKYCTVYFNNEKWEKVGIRFKGNSSLRTTYQQGIKKLSFKLDFDQFENEFPEIKNQRFYGFKQLNLKNNYDDKSFMREKVASDLFADFGLISPKTAFYRVFVDFGKGSQYFGLYTLVEEVDDTVIKTINKKGNLYKPNGFTATFAKGSFNSTDTNKKNNKKSKDFSDIHKLYTVLNSLLRTENHELWKSELSAIFDVPVFLKWLAANTAMQNWDSYGKTFHNYYLYNNPSVAKLQWIPWDNNEAFQTGKMGGAPSLSLSHIDNRWPLIRYILDDDEWYNEYKLNVLIFANEVFTVAKITSLYNVYQNVLSNYVIGDQGEKVGYTFLEHESDFYEAVNFLKQQVVERKNAVEEFQKKIMCSFEINNKENKE